MPLYIIKNNIKLMLRNKWLMVMVIAGPIITIAVLSSAFEDMMKTYKAPDVFNVGYRMNENSELAGFINEIKQYGDNAGLAFIEYKDGEAEDILAKNDCTSFVEFIEGKYIVYKLDNYVMESMMTEYFLDTFIKNVIYSNIDSQNNISNIDKNISIKTVDLDFIPSIEAKDYYGIIESVYYMWLCFISLSCILADEKKYGIKKRHDVSPVSSIKLYIANMSACILITILEMSIAITAVTYMYEIKWGNIKYTIFLLLLTGIAAAALGLFLTYLFNNLAVTVVAVFAIVWLAGFFGGSFETYMYSPWPESVKQLTPIYHINRALVEFSCKGNSKYAWSAVLYLSIMTIVCVLGGAAITRIRKGKS